ncbi:protein spinster homolog 1 [Callorhinchus milii]|uniref:protein spinster homolog 1 n=1 Tax=Callorhinchus milii TaxID=7868 RepID=UPI001C3FC234|nr:protein spinster homolog 1 [Callorhinchus milii]XP_007898356.2 protein spinster homolog 1 [Callorhinchus milii]XP_007898358.2 protein spinster homolog 1 [Callorhinchus milii]
MGVLDVCQTGAYPIYVLSLLLLTYLLNQLDRYVLAIVAQPLAQDLHFGDRSCLQNGSEWQGHLPCANGSSEERCLSFLNDNGSHYCKWDFNGNGWEYQVIAGPVFILIYTFMGVVMGFLADATNRKNLLSLSLFLWSLLTLLMGFAKRYWHLVLMRFGQAIGEAGCTPFAVSLIMDYFPAVARGSAMGVYNWGIYGGYSLAYAIGSYIPRANINGMGWRWAFFLSGMPGLLLGVVLAVTVREPPRAGGAGEEEAVGNMTLREKLRTTVRSFLNPPLLLLCLAGSVRNAGGYVWAYNAQNYFNFYYSQVDVGRWLSWIPLVGGFLGALLGGVISDRVVQKRGLHARIWVLVISQVAAAPCVAGALWLKPPYCFLSLIPGCMLGEMWGGVTLTIVVELVGPAIRSCAVGFYLFIISNVGGNAPLLLPALSQHWGLRGALLLLYPGTYLAGSLLFLLTLFVLRRDQETSEERRPLLSSSSGGQEHEGGHRKYS